MNSTRRHIPEDDILHIHRPQDLKSYIALIGWAVEWWRHVFHVRFELGFYIPEHCILHSHRREHLKSYYALSLSETRILMVLRVRRSPFDFEGSLALKMIC
jgi:hypothetical protein